MHDALAFRPTRSFLLVDDDAYSARFFTRQLKSLGADNVNIAIEWVSSAADGMAALRALLSKETHANAPDLIVIDLKGSSVANLDFLSEAAPLLKNSPLSLVVFSLANAPENKKALIDAGAVAVFERHADLEKYGKELMGLMQLSAQRTRAA